MHTLFVVTLFERQRDRMRELCFPNTLNRCDQARFILGVRNPKQVCYGDGSNLTTWQKSSLLPGVRNNRNLESRVGAMHESQMQCNET